VRSLEYNLVDSSGGCNCVFFLLFSVLLFFLFLTINKKNEGASFFSFDFLITLLFSTYIISYTGKKLAQTLNVLCTPASLQKTSYPLQQNFSGIQKRGRN